MEVSSISLHISTQRILPTGPITGYPGVFHIEEDIFGGYVVRCSLMLLLQVVATLEKIAADYEAAQVALPSDLVEACEF